ncbi:MAG: thiamine-phosphate kinase [Flavobacteriales bacterium]|nr:thiamine-phosphate kinase [Flavobacteriales bacterium]
MSETKRTELSTLGEFGLIAKLTENVEIKHDSTYKGIGDDAAVLDKEDHFQLISTDMLMEGVHFNLMYCPLKHLGYKSIVVNLSDIYAMNGTPEYVTVSIAVSNRFSLEALEEFYEGVNLACKLYNVDLIGGDTTSSMSGFAISVTAVGRVKKDKISYRSGAQENDLLVVTGDLGAAYMGLQILEREKKVFETAPSTQPDLAGKDYILERQLKPEARKDIIAMFEKMGLRPTSMIDISDGLASECIHIAKASDKGFTIYEDKVPIDPTTFSSAREFNLDPITCALNGGEDYELLFTIDQADHEKVKGNPNMTFIGHITDKASGYQMISTGGSSVDVTAQGWDPIK